MISATEARQIANEVVEGRVLNDPVFFLSLLAITTIASAIGSYISSYFKKRGEALATKADFQELLSQLKESTQLAEEIKGDVQSRYGEAASMRALLRDRTERIVMATFDLELWLEQARSKAIDGQSSEAGGSPMSKVSALRDIYFPEINVEYQEFYQRHFAYIQWIHSIQMARLENGNNLQPVRDVLATLDQVYPPFLAAVVRFRAQIIASARARGGL